MARLAKSATTLKSKLSKEEIEMRTKIEGMLKTSTEEVYKVPSELNEQTQNIYMALVEKLKPLDILCDLDQELLITVADAIYQMKVARESINKHGQVIYVKNDNGELVKTMKNVSTETYKIYESIFRASCSQLGLSPSSRAKISAELANAALNSEETGQEEMTQEEKEIAWLVGDIKEL